MQRLGQPPFQRQRTALNIGNAIDFCGIIIDSIDALTNHVVYSPMLTFSIEALYCRQLSMELDQGYSVA